MRLQDRSRLLTQGLLVTETLHPATVIFAGFDPIAASYRATAQTQALRFGGMTEDAPRIYLIRKTLIPEGLVFEPKTTTFDHDGATYRIDSLDDEASEPQVRLTCNLASR